MCRYIFMQYTVCKGRSRTFVYESIPSKHDSVYFKKLPTLWCIIAKHYRLRVYRRISFRKACILRKKLMVFFSIMDPYLIGLMDLNPGRQKWAQKKKKKGKTIMFWRAGYSLWRLLLRALNSFKEDRSRNMPYLKKLFTFLSGSLVLPSANFCNFW